MWVVVFGSVWGVVWKVCLGALQRLAGDVQDAVACLAGQPRELEYAVAFIPPSWSHDRTRARLEPLYAKCWPYWRVGCADCMKHRCAVCRPCMRVCCRDGHPGPEGCRLHAPPSDCVPLLGPAGMHEAPHVEAYRDVCCVEAVYTTFACAPWRFGRL